MSNSIIRRPIEVGQTTCVAVLLEGHPTGSWTARVELPDGRSLVVPGTYDTEGQAVIACIDRAKRALAG